MANPIRVLVVEDSESDADWLVHHLRRSGYDPIWQRVDSAEALTKALDDSTWDIVISDHSMPGFSAPEALSILTRRALDLPFIIVSRALGEEKAVEAMKAGAHDYLMKSQLARLGPAIERELREVEVRRERKIAGEALLESTRRYQDLVDSVDAVVWEGDPQTLGFSYVSPQVSRILGYSPERWSENPEFWKQRIHPDDLDQVLFYFSKAISECRNHEFEYRMLKPNGEIIWVRNIVTIVTKVQKPVLLRGILLDITERKAQALVLEHQATHDSLTNLPNRTLLIDRLRQAALSSRRENKPLALMLMDLDHFKEINDTLGHQTGDILLQQVGPRIQRVLRESDTAARLGGDEFAVLLPNTDIQGATAAAQKILEVLEHPFIVEGLSVNIGISIGTALFPEHGADAETLMRCADVAMYMAKQSGSGHAVYISDQDPYSPGRLMLLSELRNGIGEGQLLLHYQPKINLQTGKIMGVEALVRWDHPKRGMIPPAQFISIAEQTGLIKPLTLWVINKAVSHCKQWHEAGIPINVAVNLSARNLQDGHLPDQVAEPLENWGLNPVFLELEITESTIMGNPGRALEILSRLSQMGVHLSIDDFGTGYSSLGYLKKLPVDEIKVDRSFVKDMTVNRDDEVIVHSTIDMAHNLGLKVVAEGVENQEIWDRLAALGCDSAQGYFISRPIPFDELTPRLNHTPWKLENA